MRVALAFVGWLALGLPCALLFWRRGRPALAVAVLPYAGALAWTLPAAFAPWWGGSLAQWPLVAGLAALALAALALPLLRSAGPAADPVPSSPAGIAVSAGVLLLAATLLVVTGATLTRGWPGYGWDGLSIWLVRAKVLAHGDALSLALFREPLLAHGHWDYPLLLPALLAGFARTAALDLHELALPLALVAAGFVPALALGLGRALPAPASAALALSPFAVSGLAIYHFHAYADPLLVITALAGLVWSATGALRRDAALVAAGGLALACCVATKNEGALWLLAAASGAAALARASGESWRAAGSVWLRSAAPGLLVFTAWRATCAQLGVLDTLPAGLRFDLLSTRGAELSAALLDFLLSPFQAPAFAACIAAVLWLAGRNARQRCVRGAALLAAPGLYLAGISAVYLATPHDLGWHVTTSLPRTLFGLAPACLAAAVLAPSLARAASAPRGEGS